ncbi:hypothetical protein AV521_32170 [Streptomyces sp. IMTB 2501]|nr:hypothetical protein AV521_32170 [Streptomyces sp. IMTB 2501]
MVCPQAKELRRLQSHPRSGRGQALDSAILVLAKDRAASMPVIATCAGISRGSLVRLFPTRKLLVQAMAEKILDDCDRVLTTQAEADTVPTEQVPAALIAEYTPFAQLWNLVYIEPEVSGLPEAGTRAKAIFIRALKLMERGQNSGLLCKDMPGTWLA